MQAAPRKRLSAAAAYSHPALGGGLGGAVNTALTRLGDATGKVGAQPGAGSFPSLSYALVQQQQNCLVRNTQYRVRVLPFAAGRGHEMRA